MKNEKCYNRKRQKSNNLNWNLVSEYRTELMGVAAIFILICHTVETGGIGKEFCYGLFHNYGVISSVLFAVFNQFDIGVDLFLFVSGIGLYYSYEKKPRFKDYYIKRIINVYIITVIITIISKLINVMVYNSFDIKELLLSTFSLKWLLGIGPSNWFISFIMVLYLIFPLLYKFIKKYEKEPYSKIIVLIISCIYFIVLYFISGTSFYDKYSLGLFRIPIFFVGCCSGYLIKNKLEINIKSFFVLGIIGIIIKLSYYTVLNNYSVVNRISYFFLFFLILLIILYMLRFFPQSVLNFLRIMGGMSLELYLIHPIIRSFVQINYFEYCNIFTYFLTVIAAIPISYAFSKLRILIVNKYNNHIKNQIKVDS